MVSKMFLVVAMIAYVEARFGQENVPIAAITAVKGGSPGAAATLGGATISDLLGAANSCAKLSQADKIVSDLGGGADAIAAAIGLVAAEKNTNPFANGNVQNVCGDASLPATPELRGITPLIDPAVDTAGAAAALSKKTQAAPLNADGLSVFDLMSQNGLGDLVKSQAAAGGAAAGGAAAGGNAGNANQNQNKGNNNAGNANNNAGNANNNAGNAAAGNGTASAGNDTAAADPECDDTAGAGAGNANNNAGNANQNANQGNNNNNQSAGNANNNAGSATGGAAAGDAAAGGAADFGKCTPTITFQGGEGNRPATEFTFQIADPVARGGQGEALNPNIITNALCNQLTNVCGANAAAKALCADGKAKVQAAGTRNKSTADLFNAAVGFPNAVTNPKGGPDDVPAGGAKAAARAMRRGLRL